MMKSNDDGDHGSVDADGDVNDGALLHDASSIYIIMPMAGLPSQQYGQIIMIIPYYDIIKIQIRQ